MQDNSPDPHDDLPTEPPPPPPAPAVEANETAPGYHYYVRFRSGTPPFSAVSRLSGLGRGEVVMVQTEHGPEPATISGPGPDFQEQPQTASGQASYTITRRANREEIDKFESLVSRETEAFKTCQTHIARHRLDMKLIRVERYFNGSKIIFYFTAENRVDFRELVKDLVQEFRTRVEIRQIGVRHETKMIGGIGCCGRELCCATFITNFAPVSIKMAKEQNLPLNPAKISGVCNRLLCCLTYEYDTYHALRKGMPKPGKILVQAGVELRVIQTNVLKGTVTVVPAAGGSDGLRVLTRPEWEPLLAAGTTRTLAPAALPTVAPTVERRQPRPPRERPRRPKGKKREGIEPDQKAGDDEGSSADANSPEESP
ncbi:MAG TPA: regulatory iron-sulfur-containing complex subunit RicT [Desulfurivibrionaceae bacterium]|nr:regulatory iron-sulfur-containing complex subunit RicT [Desulfurivibrionaceae bacterium]